MKHKALYLAIAMGLGGFSNASAANEMVNPDGNVVVGYWHNWCDGGGYKGGNAPCMTLEEVNPMYNVVNVSFMQVYNTNEGRIPTFKLNPEIGLSEPEFIDQIDTLNKQGRSVLIALGGADALVELQSGDEFAFAQEIIRVTDKYGFDGLDIDLEQSAVTAADNQTVIPAALKIVKDHYKQEGKNFLITMAPEFPYITSGGKYVPYLTGLEGYYDWINPQFYNQGGDGLWIDGVGWLAQNNDNLKKEFIYFISDSLANGSRGFYNIPHDKLVFGIPSNIDAAATGFVKNPQDLYDAFSMMSAQGQPLRGVMTWSVNWDIGTNAAGQPYNSEFIKSYGSFIHGSQVPVSTPSEGAPVFKGLDNARVVHGSSFDPYSGVTAADKEDGDVTSSISVEGSVNENVIGDYVLTYVVTDSDGNEVKKSRTVTVYSLAPKFSGVASATVLLGESFDPLKGVEAHDEEDGDLTSSIEIEGEVNTDVLGQYSLTYKVTDSAGQTTTAIRDIKVTDGSTCEHVWSADEVYTGGDQVSFNGGTWEAGWWTRGEEPGSTGNWGVWKKVDDHGCGTSIAPSPQAEPEVVQVPSGAYPLYEAGKKYQAGDIVEGLHGGVFQCKPWPFSGWCANPSYAPGESAYWTDAWDKVEIRD